MYAAFTRKILNYILDENHPVAVSEFVDRSNNPKDKNKVFIFIVPGSVWFSRVIGRNGQTINLIENLLKMKGYLNDCWVTIKVEN